MSAQDLWDKLDALPWPGPWVAHTFEIDCPCPNGEHCGDAHDCAEVEDRTAYPSSPEKPAEPGHGQCVVQINTPGLETFAKPCAEFIAAARNELPAIRARLAELEMQEHNDDANRYHQSLGAKWMCEAIVREMGGAFSQNRHARAFAEHIARKWSEAGYWRPGAALSPGVGASTAKPLRPLAKETT